MGHADNKLSFRTHVNEDGSKGGRVAHDAVVEKGAIIEPFAVVLSGAFVAADRRIEAGDIVTSNGSTIRLAPPLKRAPS